MSLAAEQTVDCPADQPLPDRALAALYRDFYRPLVGLCNRQLRDQSLAEDVAQETMLRALRFWTSYDAQKPTWPWLKAIALRLCADAHRSRMRECCYAELPEPAYPAYPADSIDAALDALTVRRAMAALTERQRTALGLRYLEDQSRAYAAAALGLNLNAFDQLLNRARVRLATVIGPAGPAALVAPFALLWRLVRRARPAAALASVAALPLVVAPLLVIAIGSGATANAAGGLASARLTGHTAPLAVRAVAHRAHAAPATPVGRPKADAAAPLVAHATVNKHPLTPGTVQDHDLEVDTPVSRVVVDGYSDRAPGATIVCTLSGCEKYLAGLM